MVVIYRFINKVNGMSYIGKADDFQRRLEEHKRNAEVGGDQCPRFYEAIREFGWENFEWVILEDCKEEEWESAERYWIKTFGTDNKKRGYNIASGGVPFHYSWRKQAFPKKKK